MNLQIDLGQAIIAMVLALLGVQGRQILRELRSLGRRITRLERWAISAGFKPADE